MFYTRRKHRVVRRLSGGSRGDPWGRVYDARVSFIHGIRGRRARVEGEQAKWCERGAAYRPNRRAGCPRGGGGSVRVIVF